MAATLSELEARVAALEAERADYGAVLAAVNALGENQREQSGRLRSIESKLDGTDARLRGTDARVRSVEDSLAELKDLVIRALER